MPVPSYRTINGLPVLRKLTSKEHRDLEAELGLNGGGPTLECYDSSLMRIQFRNCKGTSLPVRFLEPEPAPFDPTADRVNRNPPSVSTPSPIPDLNEGIEPEPEATMVPEQEVGQLLPVMTRQVANEQVNTVDARDLHRFLGVGKDFSTWIKGRIIQFNFASPEDYMTVHTAPQNGGAVCGSKVEYALTLDMAKELAMVERTPRGKQARLYFIEVDKQWRAQQAPKPQRALTPSEMFLAQAQLNIDHERQIQMLSEQNRTLAREQAQLGAKLEHLSATVTQPMIDVYGGLALAGDNVSMMWVCKRLGVQLLALFKHLRDRRVLMTGGRKHNYPFSPWEHCFATTTVPVNKGERMATATKVTPDGIKWLCRCYHRGEFDAFLNRPRREQLDLSRTPGDDDQDVTDL